MRRRRLRRRRVRRRQLRAADRLCSGSSSVGGSLGVRAAGTLDGTAPRGTATALSAKPETRRRSRSPLHTYAHAFTLTLTLTHAKAALSAAFSCCAASAAAPPQLLRPAPAHQRCSFCCPCRCPYRCPCRCPCRRPCRRPSCSREDRVRATRSSSSVVWVSFSGVITWRRQHAQDARRTLEVSIRARAGSGVDRGWVWTCMDDCLPRWKRPRARSKVGFSPVHPRQARAPLLPAAVKCCATTARCPRRRQNVHRRCGRGSVTDRTARRRQPHDWQRVRRRQVDSSIITRQVTTWVYGKTCRGVC